MVSLGNPLAGGAITSGGNAAIDIATGNVPSFKNPEDALLYLGKEAAFGAATSFAGAQAGKIIGPALSKLGNSVGGWFKHGFQTYAQESLQTVLINGKPITTSIEVGIKATKQYVAKALGSSVGGMGGRIINGASVGNTSSLNYRDTFFQAFPHLENQVVVHHAIEQQVLTRYPNTFTAQEIHSLENLRGIPNDLNNTLHLSQIRRSWNTFYRNVANPSRQQILNKATEIDKMFGSQFLPKR